MNIPKLVELFKRKINEADDEPKVSANPFDEPAKAKPKLPTPGSAGVAQKSQARSASVPSKRVEPQTQLQKAYSDFEKLPQKRGGSQIVSPSKEGPKPPYKGSFFGQTWETNAQVQSKPVSWMDKQSGDRRFGRVNSMGKAQLVWDGNDWLPVDEFNQKYSKK